MSKKSAIKFTEQLKKDNTLNSIPVPATPQTHTQYGFVHLQNESEPKSEPNKSQYKQSNSSSLHNAFIHQKGIAAAMNRDYKPAQLYSANKDVTKRWYVYFYYLIPGSTDEFKRFREYLGINKIKSITDKLLYAKEAVAFINDQLAVGFNPFIDVNDDKAHSDQIVGILNQLKYIIAIFSEYASKSQLNTYNEMINRFTPYIDQKKLHHCSMHHFSIRHAKEFKNYMLFDKDLAVKTCNNTISHLAMFFDRAVEEQFCEDNPFRKITRAREREKPQDELKDKRFEPITDAEMIKIFTELKKANQQNFINFLSFVYYAWVRPVEILRLKVEDIELDRSVIRFKKGKTKNGLASYVQIVPPLMEIINKMELQKYDGDHYLFSGNYTPGTVAISKNNPSARWRDQVKGKLKISKDLYALKHTGNIEYLLRNKGAINLKWQQLQNRHSSTVITEQYNKRIGAFFIEMKDINFRII